MEVVSSYIREAPLAYIELEGDWFVYTDIGDAIRYQISNYEEVGLFIP